MAVIPLTTRTDLRGAKQLNKVLQKTDDELAEITKRARGAEGAARRLAEQADPQRKYNRQMADLAKHVKAGRLEFETAEKLADRYGERLNRAGQAGNKAFGAGMASNITTVATSVLSASSAAAFLGSELLKVESRAQAAADSINRALEGFGELSQISDSPTEFANNVALANRLVGEGVVSPDDRKLSTKIAFGLNSATKVDKELMIKLGSQRVVEAAALADTAASVNTVLESVGVEEAGTTRDVLNKAIASAKPTKATFPEILAAVAAIGPQTNTLGFTDEAAFGATSVITRQTGSAPEARTRLKAFLAVVDTKGIQEGSLLGTVKAIATRVDQGEKVQAILGENQQAIEGFRFLNKDLALLESEIGRVDRSQVDNPLAVKLGLIDTAPALRASRLKARAEGRLANLTADASTEREDLLDAGVAEIKARNLERYGANSIRAWLANLEVYLASGVADVVQNDVGFLRTRRDTFGMEFSPGVDAAIGAPNPGSVAAHMAEAADSMAVAAEKIGASVGGGAQE